MSDQWYYEHEMNKRGPVSSRQLRDLADAGQIRPTDTIWKEGVERGVSAAKVKNLFGASGEQRGESPPVAPSSPQTAVVPSAPCATAVSAVAELPPTADTAVAHVGSPAPGAAAAEVALAVAGLPPTADTAVAHGGSPAPGAAAAEVAPPPAPPTAAGATPEAAAPGPTDTADAPQEKAADKPAPVKNPVKKSKAVAVRGLLISNQDGSHVQFKKKCVVCGHEDPNKMRVPIKNGMNRISFYCNKCRKMRQAEFQGIS